MAIREDLVASAVSLPPMRHRRGDSRLLTEALNRSNVRGMNPQPLHAICPC